jgi:6-phosphogluconolactonase
MSERIFIDQKIYIKEVSSIILDIIERSPGGLVILGGGNSPKKINAELSIHLEKNFSLKEHFYHNFKFFLSDERYVDLMHLNSNYRMLKETLFQDSDSLIPFPTHLPIEECVKEYEKLILKEISNSNIVFSLLGIGDDGHTASLFPGQFKTTEEIVLDGGAGPEGLKRMSLGHKLLLKSQKTLFLMNSEAKYKAYENASVQTDTMEYPLIPFIASNHSYFYQAK